MDQKRALLDAALDTFDGNCITTVLLFIRKTLNHRKPQREGGVLAALTHLSLSLSFSLRDPDDDGEDTTECCQSLLQLSQAAACLERAHYCLPVRLNFIIGADSNQM